jgi:hypothetical protein
MILYYMIYLLTAGGLPPGGHSNLHKNNTQNDTKILEECGPCPVFCELYSGISLTIEENGRKTSYKLFWVISGEEAVELHW